MLDGLSQLHKCSGLAPRACNQGHQHGLSPYFTATLCIVQGEALGVGPGAAMDAALARLNRAEEDVAALREAIKVDCPVLDLAFQSCKGGPACLVRLICSEIECCPCRHDGAPLTLAGHVQAAQAKARLAMPKKKKKGEDAVDGNPVFEVPAEEKLFKGDPNDRKALLRHKQHVKARLPPAPLLCVLHTSYFYARHQSRQGLKPQPHAVSLYVSRGAHCRVAVGLSSDT